MPHPWYAGKAHLVAWCGVVMHVSMSFCMPNILALQDLAQRSADAPGNQVAQQALESVNDGCTA